MCRPVDDIRAWWVVSLREEQTDDGDMVMQTVETWWLNQRGGCQEQAVKRWGSYEWMYSLVALLSVRLSSSRCAKCVYEGIVHCKRLHFKRKGSQQ